MEKTCSICGQTKPTSEYEVGTSVGGAVKSYKSYCKVCSYAKRRDGMAAAPKHDPASVPEPLECDLCKRGPGEVRFQWRSGVRIGSWRQPCYACLNAKGHSQKHRERKRAEDEEGYLRRNAEQHWAWSQANPDKVKEQQRLARVEADRKIKGVRTSANAREIRFEEQDLAAMTAKLCQACRYCGYAPEPGEELNGLDRVVNDGDYTDANTVPACGACNGMKGAHTVDMFVSLVRRIVAHRQLAVAADAEVPKPPPALSGSHEAREAAAKKQKLELLPYDVKVQLLCGRCYLCSRAPALGIDRMDSEGDYVDGNVQPCCSDCNYLKKHHTVAQLDVHLPYIARHMAAWEITSDVNSAPMYVPSKQARVPVKATLLDGSGAMMFPSIGIAAKVTKIAETTIRDAVAGRGHGGGCRWTTACTAEYRQQHVSCAEAERVVYCLRNTRRQA